MNRRKLLKASAGLLGAVAASGQILNPGQVAPNLLVRSRIRLHEDWRFTLGDVPGGERPDYDFSTARRIQLPHDWSIEGPISETSIPGDRGGFLPAGIGWYWKAISIQALNRDQRVLLEFEGVYRYSRVWVNGNFLGLMPNGFVPFEYDITPHLIPGRTNIIAVRVDNSVHPNLRWYSGSGIYRHVWLTFTNQVRVGRNGVCVTTPSLSRLQASVRVTTTVLNESPGASATRVVTTIFDPSGRVVGESSAAPLIGGQSKADVTQNFVIPFPLLWEIDNPFLYTAYTVIRRDGQRVDDFLTTFGIREVVFDKDKGFLLNGRSFKLKGASLHHDLGCLGAAVHERAIERRLLALRQLGVNAIRTSHNPPARELIELCDRMGFAVINEAFDKWFGDFVPPAEGEPQLSDTWESDLESFILRDRNNPSVVLWSIGNEAGRAGSEEHDYWTERITSNVRKLDPTRAVTVVIAPVDGPPSESVPAVARTAKMVDVIGLNYQEALLDQYREAFPSVPMIATEAFPFFRLGFETFESRNPWYDSRDRDYVAGHFVWNGVDHLGESTGWPSKGWPNGLLNTCAIAKPASAFFETVWRDIPNVRLMVVSETLNLDLGFLPWRWPQSAFHWNLPELLGKPARVWCVSNCETVELFQDGDSMGEKVTADFPNQTLEWVLPYKPGKLEAIGRNKGVEVARDLLQSAGKPARIEMKADRERIRPDGLDISHVDVWLEDSEGVLVPDVPTRLIFSIRGPGRILGVDNGELRSMEPFQGESRTTFQGRAMVVVQSTGEPGQITLFCLGPDLPPAAAGIAAIAT